MIRFFDILFSLLGLLLLSPLFVILCLAICLESKGGAFYIQENRLERETLWTLQVPLHANWF